ncbi:MAG: hypothetical protein IJ859_12250, partial [Synergistaceae bacterium]|nr:hypothetical protein [Synergistaceae bacterium]
SELDVDNGTDRFFLLSVADVNNTSYFSSKDDRKCDWINPSTYNGNCDWWLRSPSNDASDKYAAFVDYTGGVCSEVNNEGLQVDRKFAVRPAVWINLNN